MQQGCVYRRERRPLVAGQKEQDPRAQISLLTLTPSLGSVGPPLWSQVNFTSMEKKHLGVDTADEQKQQRLGRQPCFWCIFASARCLITVQLPSKNKALKCPCSHSLISTVYTFPNDSTISSERWALVQNMTCGFIYHWSVQDVGGFLLSWLAYIFFELNAM